MEYHLSGVVVFQKEHCEKAYCEYKPFARAKFQTQCAAHGARDDSDHGYYKSQKR
jgi:hypothetical protein